MIIQQHAEFRLRDKLDFQLNPSILSPITGVATLGRVCRLLGRKRDVRWRSGTGSRMVAPVRTCRSSASDDALSQGIRLMIITDVRLYREGLTQALANRPELVLVGSMSPHDEGLGATIDVQLPDVVLVDSATARATDVCTRIIAEGRGTKIVTFAVAEEDGDEILACAEAGVTGFVAREATADELVSAIDSAAHGDVACSPQVAAAVIRRVASLSPTPTQHPEHLTLTQREREVLHHLEAGLSNKQIASELGIEIATVKNHVHHVLEKLSLARRGEAAAFLRTHWASPALRLPHPKI